MDKKTLKALKESIEHWYWLSEYTDYDDVRREGYGSLSCALCSLFLEHGCIGCPIYSLTKMIDCKGTPYDVAADSLEEFKYNDWNAQDQKNITAQIRFLEDLLPEGERYWE